jgi:small-conductance mechanosensitive channel
MEARGVSPDVVHLVRRVYLILILVIIGVSALEILSVPLTAFAFISGAIAIGVGFGAQNVINNFISGWILLWERPIRIGDFLEIGDTRGTVEAINTRSTRIRRVDGVHLLIPNSHLLENTVVNWTLVDRLTRGHVRVGVAYGSPVRLVAQLIEQVAKENAHVLETPGVMVIFDDFGDSALIFDVYFWIEASGEKDLRVIRSDIRFRIDELFREHNITISFPQRDVHLTSLTPVQVALVNDTENAGG